MIGSEWACLEASRLSPASPWRPQDYEGGVDSSVKDEGDDPPPAYGSKQFNLGKPKEPNLQQSSYTSSLWAEAVGKNQERTARRDTGARLPDNLDTSGAAQNRATRSQRGRGSTEGLNRKRTPDRKSRAKNGQEGQASRCVRGNPLLRNENSETLGTLPFKPLLHKRLCHGPLYPLVLEPPPSTSMSFYGVIIQGLEMVSSIVSHLHCD